MTAKPFTSSAVGADDFLICFEARVTPYMAGKWLGRLRGTPTSATSPTRDDHLGTGA